ncbi:MAG TPA: hypothetical protein VM557_00070 [Thermoanaerobaculia bacterium]|nr:hypothetical protein [Thermoanaerobaculia bacterium]
MNEMNDVDDEEYEEQIERMIVENGMMLRGLANLLVRKGLVSQEEVDEEMDRLYDEMEEYEGEDERE